MKDSLRKVKNIGLPLLKKDKVLDFCAPFIKNGTYRLYGNGTILALDGEAVNGLSLFADAGALGSKSDRIKRRIVDYLSKKEYPVSNSLKGPFFEGSLIVIASTGKRFKIFDYESSKILTKYLNVDEFDKCMKKYESVRNIYPAPEIISIDRDNLYTIEKYLNCYDRDTQIGDIFTCIIKHYISSVDLFERRDDMIKCHGDLWSSNIIMSKGRLNFIDFESVGYYPFYYDIFHFMFSEALINNERSLLDGYFDGAYDDLLKKYFSYFNHDFIVEKRVSIFREFVAKYKEEKWSKLKPSDRDKMTKKLDDFLLSLEYSSKDTSFVSGVLRGLECCGIDYAVLRGFRPIEGIEKSKDVDICIPRRFRKRVKRYFNSRGWYHQRINCCRYPHEQYIYMTSLGYKKIDVVYGLYYGDDLLRDNEEEKIMKRRIKLGDINVLSDRDALEELVLHVCFDKGELSKENHLRIEKAMEIYKSSASVNGHTRLASMAQEMIDDYGGEMGKYKREIRSGKRLSSSVLRRTSYKLKHRFNNYFRTVMVRLRARNICLIGVDGSGKSTLAKKIEEIFDGKVTMGYMGFKDYRLSFVQRRLESRSSKRSKIGLTIDMTYQWIDFWSRYLHLRFKSKFVVFDRYPDEAIINSTGVAHILSIIFFRILFPKSGHKYYLYCQPETSFSRKDDILDKGDFVKKKERFDRKYIKGRHVTSFSTDQYTTEEILEFVIDDFNNKYLRYLI